MTSSRPAFPGALTILLLNLTLPLGAVAAAEESAARAVLRPRPEDPRYWEYEGRPVLLAGGTKTDHIFLIDDLEEHLDELVAAGGNYVRCTMSQREGPDLKPHARLPDGRFDLEKWNEDYWSRFARCLELSEKRDIIVQVEVWDRFDFSQEHWVESPWRPAGNVNYTPEGSGLRNHYPAPAWRDRQPFFHTLRGMRLYREELELVRRHQERFVEKILSRSLDHPNVLYCMNNETSTDPRWGRHWMELIRKRARERGLTVYATDMFDDVWKPRESEKLAAAIADPEMYPFIDISQVNSRTFGDDHWRNLRWIVERAHRHPRPLNHVKIYGAGETRWGSGTPADGIERMWRDLIGGSAAVRFHRDGAGIGLGPRAKACLSAVREVESLVRFWEVEPRQDLLGEREEDEAYLAARPGEAYVLYFTDGGAVTVDLREHPGPFRLTWVDISSGRARSDGKREGGARVSLDAPGSGGWVAVLRAAVLTTARETLRVHMISGSKEYRSEASLEKLERRLEKDYDIEVSASWAADGARSLENIDETEEADLLIVFARRLKLPEEQIAVLRRHWERGKPVIGIRTASHAFSREVNAEFDREVLGNHYAGHYGGEPVEVETVGEHANHPVLRGVGEITSRKLYKAGDLPEDTVVLQIGDIGKARHPVTLVHEYRGARMFYTSLGVPEDFEDEDFIRLLTNAVFWTTGRREDADASKTGE